MSVNNTDDGFLGRLDERTKSIQLILEKLENDLRVNNSAMSQKIDITEARLTKRIDGIENDYVRKDQFSPIQRIVYGLVGIVLSTVAGALIATVVARPA